MNCVLQNAIGITLFPASVGPIDLRIRNGVIVDRKKHLALLPGEKAIDLSGRYIMPGLVCAHTHLYSSLSRGMPRPKKAPTNFKEILEKVWWKLDRALDDESIYYSALMGAIDAVRCGTTSIIDHHASPSSIGGSLDIIRDAIEKIGLRGVCCYEVTDRGGKRKRNEGLAENERFIRVQAESKTVRGVVGAHASFTLSDESLELCGALAQETGVGVHIHVAEDTSDTADAWGTHGASIVDRLSHYSLLKKGSILAHCVHLSPEEITAVRAAGCRLVHNPRSNMNNRVGYAPVHLFGGNGALGTDGFPADMFTEAESGFFKRQDTRVKESVDFMELLDGGQRIISDTFGAQFGRLDVGSAADLIVMDYDAPTPVTRENCAGHFLFGMRSSMVESVMVNGVWIVKDRSVVAINTADVYAKAAQAAKKMWARMEKL